MPENVHVHAPHELAEPGEATGRREKVLEIVAALLLSIATVGIAWSGYQAARWSGIQARRYTQASAARSLANRASTVAALQRTQDLLNFNRWLEVSTTGDAQLAALYERRFRPEFLPAFEAWVASDPVHNPKAESSPLRVPEYKLAEQAKSNRYEAIADRRFEQGKHATEVADRYVFITVIFAVVLFFAGISLRFGWYPMRIVILGLGTGLLVWSAVRMFELPTR